MLLNLYKRTIKSKIVYITFFSFAIINCLFLIFCFYASRGHNDFYPTRFNNIIFIAFFWVSMVAILIISLIIKGVIFENDIKYIIVLERQYEVKKWKIYFYRLLVLYSFILTYITLLLLTYFILVAAMISSAIDKDVWIVTSVGYVAYLYLFSWFPIGLSLITLFIKNNPIKYTIPFVLILSLFLMNMFSTFFFMQRSPRDDFRYQELIEQQSELNNYYNLRQKAKSVNIDFKKLNDIKPYDWDDNYSQGTKDDYKKEIETIFPLVESEKKYDWLDESWKQKYDCFFLQEDPDIHNMYTGLSYSKSNIYSISYLFEQLSEKSVKNKGFYHQISIIYKDFEKNNRLNGYEFHSNKENTDFLDWKNLKSSKKVINNNEFEVSIQAYILDKYLDNIKTFLTNNNPSFYNSYKNGITKYKEMLKSSPYLNPYLQFSIILSNKSYNLDLDLNKSSYINLDTGVSTIRNYSVDGYDVSYNLEHIYYYEVIVIEYLILLVLLNGISYLIFCKKTF